MTADLLALAVECGAERMTDSGPHILSTDSLDAFAARIRAEALEEAAKACEGAAWSHQNTAMLGPEQKSLRCAAAIRALAQPPGEKT